MGHRWPVTLKDDEDGEWVGEQRPELADLSALFEHLVRAPLAEEPSNEEWRAALPPQVHLIRSLGRHTVHVRLPHGEVKDVVIKLAPPATHGLRRLAESLGHSKSHRRYLWAHRLRALGIDAPRPLGFVERARQPALERSFVASEYIFADNLMDLHDKLPAALAAGGEPALERRALIRRVAAFVRDLHARGLFPRELSARCILVTERSILLACPDLVGGPILRTERAAQENLGQLARSFARSPWLSRADRLRFVDTYLAHQGRRREARRALLVLLDGEPPVEVPLTAAPVA